MALRSGTRARNRRRGEEQDQPPGAMRPKAKIMTPASTMLSKNVVLKFESSLAMRPSPGRNQEA